MKQIVCVLFCMLFSLTLSAQNKNTGLSGKWEFNATDVPSEYEKGSFEFKTEEGKLKVIITVNFNKITVDQIEQEGDTYKCSLNVEGSDVDLVFKQNAGKLEADAKVDGEKVGLSLKKLD